MRKSRQTLADSTQATKKSEAISSLFSNKVTGSPKRNIRQRTEQNMTKKKKKKAAQQAATKPHTEPKIAEPLPENGQ